MFEFHNKLKRRLRKRGYNLLYFSLHSNHCTCVKDVQNNKKFTTSPRRLQHFNSQKYETRVTGPAATDLLTIVIQLLSRSPNSVAHTQVSSGSHRIPPLTSCTPTTSILPHQRPGK